MCRHTGRQQPLASGYHRFAMTALAVNGVDGPARPATSNCATPGPSLHSRHADPFASGAVSSASQIFFITGADAFAEIETWHRYPDVLDLANFVVVSRPGFCVEDVCRDRLPALVRTHESACTAQRPRSRQPAARGQDHEHFSRGRIDARRVVHRHPRAAGGGEPIITDLFPPPSNGTSCSTGFMRTGAGPLAADHLHDEN